MIRVFSGLCLMLSASVLSPSYSTPLESLPQQSIRFIVDESLQERVSRPVVEYRIASWVDANNDLFRKNGIDIERVATSYQVKDLTDSNSFGVYGLFNRLGASVELRERFGLGGDYYTVFVVDAKEEMAGCSVASTRNPTQKYTVMALALTGACSFDYMMMHEIGHNDGLTHHGERGGGRCLDHSFSIMSTSMSKGRSHLMGSEGCPTSMGMGTESPYATYAKLETILTRDNPLPSIELPDYLALNVNAYSFKGLRLSLKPEYLEGFERRIDGEYYVAFPENSDVSFGKTAVIKLDRVKSGLSGKLSLKQKKSFTRALGQRVVIWIGH